MADQAIVYESVYYCSLCDRYFPDVQSRADHIQFTTNHPKCEKCDVRFANKNALRNHFTISRRHHYCSLCRMHFQTAAGFRAHVQYASVHREDDDSDEEDEDGIDYSYDGWEDDVGRARFPEEDDDYFEPSVVDDDVVDPEDEYWDEDEELDPEEEDYLGFALVPPANDVIEQMADPASLPTPTLEPILSVGTPDVEKPDALKVNAEASKDNTQSSTSQHPAAGNSGDVIIPGCPLCLEPTNQPCVTRCGHIFCRSCVTQALDVKRRCPVCRVPAAPKQLRTIFFTTPV